MESGLMSGFHDDHFDDSYVEYDIGSSYWSEGSNSLGLQLAETLNGILPISPAEVNEHCFENDSTFVFNENYTSQKSLSVDYSKNLDAAAYSIIDNSNQTTSSPFVEVISVDPNYEYDSSRTDSDDNDEFIENNYDELESIDNNYFDEEDELFYRNRTESSSIDDYESHSSDDDNENSDDKSNIKLFHKYEENAKTSDIKPKNEHKLEHDKNNKNNILQIDDIQFKKFDLAEFITKDDDVIKKEQNNDEDSDVDIDVETVQDNEIKFSINSNCNDKKNNELIYNNLNNIQIEDDLIKDPSWSPSSKSAAKKVNKTKNNAIKKGKMNHITTTVIGCGNSKARSILKNNLNNLNKQQNNSMGSNKKAPIILERKIYGLGRGKNISMCSREISPSISEAGKNLKNSLNTKSTQKIEENSDQNNKEIMKTYLDKSNNNEKYKISETVHDDAVNLIKNYPQQKQENPIKILSANVEIKVSPVATNDHDYAIKPSSVSEVPVKKKLNLEEYKKRRGVSTAGGDVLNIANSSCQTKFLHSTTKTTIISNQNQTPVKIAATLTPTKQKILEKLENNPIDPITEAKNKVLRLKELKKKAALDRIIDSTVSAKVGPITKILPLEEIVRNSSNVKKEEKIPKKINMNEYEEIIIVSASCNTDLTIPPEFDRLEKEKIKLVSGDGASLFYNISDTLQKANSIENVKISSSSLISSIQDIALKKLNTTPLTLLKTDVNQQQQNHESDAKVTTTAANANITPLEHGEDKIIMHLRKDRVRIPKQSTSTQTVMLPQFPILKLLISPNDKKLKCADKRRRRGYRSRRSSSYSSNNDDENGISYHSSHNSSHHSRSSLKKRSRRNSYRNNDNTNLSVMSRCSNSRDSISPSSSSSESGIGRRGRSRERRKRRYSSTSPGGSSSRSRSSSTNRSRSRSSRSSCSSRSRSLSTTSSSSSSSSKSRSSSHSSYTRSESIQYKNRKSRSRGCYKRRERDVSPAVEERRIVYVGRIEQETSKEDLKRKFITYGPIRQITLHYKDTGMKYGFVTFEKAQDAYKAIDNGTKDPKVNMYDISFGGRRQFCGSSYSDLDGAATNSLQMCSYPSMIHNTKKEEDSFEALLAKVKEKLSNSKKTSLSSSFSHRDKT